MNQIRNKLPIARETILWPVEARARLHKLRGSFRKGREDAWPGGSLQSQQTDREPTREIGDLIFPALEENVIIETAPWAIERVDRVLKRLHKARGIVTSFPS